MCDGLPLVDALDPNRKDEPMARRPKDQGTARETTAVRNAEQHPGIHAQRAPNNAPSYDVDLRVAGLGTVRVEVKDRQQLNAHRTVKDAQAANPDRPVALLWHRTSKKDGAKRSHPDGPTLYMVDEDLFLRLLSLAGLAAFQYEWREHRVGQDVNDDIGRALEELDDLYPDFR